MAKSSSFFGLRQGSTKSLTFQVLRGQQITKDRVTRVSNPRSEAQMTQRALIKIVAAARAQLKGLVDHSFEGVAYGESSLREFSRLNLRAGAIGVASYSPNGVSNAGFASLQVSKGTINGDFHYAPKSINGAAISSNMMYPKLAFPAAAANDPATAIFSYLETWAKTNNVPMLAPGTQLSILTIYKAGTVGLGNGDGAKIAPLSAFVIDRFMIPDTAAGKTDLSDVNGAWKVAGQVTEGDAVVELVNNDGDSIHISCIENGNLNIDVKPRVAGDDICGVALILSRFENGSWRRNTASIEIPDPPTPAYTFDDWLSVYQTTGAASKKYLNNGNEKTGIKG